jgi:hypothetical protein
MLIHRICALYVSRTPLSDPSFAKTAEGWAKGCKGAEEDEENDTYRWSRRCLQPE